MNKSTVWMGVALALAACSAAMGQTQGSLPTVNGEPLSPALYEQGLWAALSRGQADSVQLREALKQELINRQLLLKEAQRRGLEKDTEYLQRLAMVREDLLVERLLQRQSDPASISVPELQKEYDRQVQSLGPAADLKEYLLRLIMLPSRDSASSVIRELGKGSAFETLAREKSIDASREQGGLVGWTLPQTLTPAVAGVMANLNKGAISVAPVETPAGWAVIRVDDVRQYKVPSFEESRDRLVLAVAQRKRAELIEGLRKTAVITPSTGTF